MLFIIFQEFSALHRNNSLLSLSLFPFWRSAFKILQKSYHHDRISFGMELASLMHTGM